MVNVDEVVYNALQSIEGLTAFFYYPKTFKKLPCVSYYEANNSPRLFSDDRSYMDEIVIVVDVWANSKAKASEIAAAVDDKMQENGFVREFSHDVHNQDSDIRHITMRFKIAK